MAITIHSTPTTPNMGNADLLFVVTGNSTQPQYQFVCDVKDANKSLLQRVKQQPNPSGKGVFNVGQIISQYISSDDTWKASPFETSSNAGKSFWVVFGEEYGSSLSSSITLYSGIASNVGQPGVSSSLSTYVVDGLVEPNSGDWNFASSSYYTASLSANITAESYSFQHALSNSPVSQSIRDNEYQTIGIFNGNFDNNGTHAQDIYYVQVNVFDSAGSNIQNFGYFNIESNAGGPRQSANEEWGDVYLTQTDGTKLLYVAAGPQNFADAGNTLNASWNSYSVTLWGQESAGIESNTGRYAQYWFTKSTGECVSNGVRFVWKNEFGVWDYYTATLAIDSSVDIVRSSYNQTQVNYSTTTNSVPYEYSRRGVKQFQNKLTQRKRVYTEYLTQENADWLKELFYSTNVYVQEGLQLLPVIVDNANILEKTNPRSQKLFQYTFEFQYANGLRPRI
jgi:hypothetical protein